MTGLVTTTI